MKKPIDKTSPLYLKRLVRELNAAGIVDGFYARFTSGCFRCNRARVRRGFLELQSPSVPRVWAKPSDNLFTDPHGREIVASTKP